MRSSLKAAARWAIVAAVVAVLHSGLNGQTAEAGRLHRRAALNCCDPCCNPCVPTKKICVTACHPCTGCPVKIELCVPVCCDDCPAVSSRRTLIGAGLVRYDWCCGFTAVVRFDRCGGYRVIYRG